jgi:alkylhydroperoxidase/carboxymuconolactone decarboxylase family protein YurZ
MHLDFCRAGLSNAKVSRKVSPERPVNREALIKKMKSERHGEISQTHRLLVQSDPEFAQRYDDLFEILMARDRLLKIRTKELIVIGMLAALGEYAALKTHMKRALRTDVTQQEIIEVLELAMMYGGAESMIHGGQALIELLDEK